MTFENEWVDTLKALGHKTRLQIVIDLQQNGTKCVTDLNDLLPSSQANISQHLTVLRNARIVDFTQDGAQRCYYICKPELIEGVIKLLTDKHSNKTASKCCINKGE